MSADPNDDVGQPGFGLDAMYGRRADQRVGGGSARAVGDLVEMGDARVAVDVYPAREIREFLAKPFRRLGMLSSA